MKRSRPLPAHGFTLIEIAIVLFVLGLLLVGVLGPIGVQMEQRDRSRTDDTLRSVQSALYGFAVAQGRLPCPDCRSSGDCPAVAKDARNDGVEDIAADKTCAALRGGRPFGNLPWATLGVGRTDAWEHPLTYAVTARFADGNDGDTCGGLPAAGVSFELCSVGDLDVEDSSDPAAVEKVADDVPAVIVAHGRNASFTVDTEARETTLATPASAAEQENADGDALYTQNGYAGDAYDDQVTWLSVPVLMERMIAAGRLP